MSSPVLHLQLPSLEERLPLGYINHDKGERGMRNYLGIMALTLVATGCSSVEFLPSGDTSVSDVRQISMREAAGCRLLDQATTQSTAGVDTDIYWAVLSRMEALTTEKSGNAFAVRSYQVQSGAGPNKAVLIADIYTCSKRESADK